MFKNMIMIMLLMTSCMDKSDKIITSTETNTVTITNYVTLEKPVASYDKEMKVTRVFSDFLSWYTYQFRGNSTKFKPELYKGVYWDQSNNVYYIATLSPANNIEYTLDTNLMYEPLYFDIFKDCISDFDITPYSEDFIKDGTITTNLLGNELLYVGSISELERVYIDRLNTNLFIKILKPVLYRYIDSNGITNITNSRPDPVYPALEYCGGMSCYMSTNAKGIPIYNLTNDGIEMFISN